MKLNLLNCPACGSAIVLTDWTETGQLICAKCGTINANIKTTEQNKMVVAA